MQPDIAHELSTEVQEGPAYRRLPTESGPRLRLLLSRAIRRRCPECGTSGIFKNWFTVKDACPGCGYVFAREGGYFLGAQHLNLVVAEVVPIGLLVGLLIWSSLSWVTLEIILLPTAVILPLLIYPFACTFWMALDLFFTPVNQR